MTKKNSLITHVLSSSPGIAQVSTLPGALIQISQEGISVPLGSPSSSLHLQVTTPIPRGLLHRHERILMLTKHSGAELELKVPGTSVPYRIVRVLLH